MSGDSHVTARAHLRDQLEPLLPTGWRLIPYQRMPRTIDQPTVLVKHISFEPLSQAPIGSLSNGLVVTIADPHADQEAAEDALDQAVLELCSALDALPTVLWTEAQKVTVGDYLGWDISATVRTDKE